MFKVGDRVKMTTIGWDRESGVVVSASRFDGWDWNVRVSNGLVYPFKESEMIRV